MSHETIYFFSMSVNRVVHPSPLKVNISWNQKETSFVVYTIVLSFGNGIEHIFHDRFSKLLKMHERIKRICKVIPVFPEKMGFRSTTDPKLVYTRSNQLKEYYKKLFQCEKVLENVDVLSSALSIPQNSSFFQYLDEYAKLYLQEMAIIKENRQYELKKQKLSILECLDNHVILSENAGFQLYGNDDEPVVIRKENSEVYFKFSRLDSKSGHWGDSRFILSNYNNHKLIEMQEVIEYPKRFYNIMMNYENNMVLFYRIHQLQDLGEHGYSIETLHESADKISTGGYWNDEKYSFHVNNDIVARIERNISWLHTFDIIISKENNIPLFIALCFCIDRMHTEGEVW